MNLKIYDVTPEGEAKIIDFLDKAFSKDNAVNNWKLMNVDCFLHDCDGFDLEHEVIINRKGCYIRASRNALEYYRESYVYSIFTCPVNLVQIKSAFISFYCGDDKFLRDFKWQPMTLFPKKYSAEYCNVSRAAAISRQNRKEFFHVLKYLVWLIPLLLIIGLFYAAFWIIKIIFSAVKSCCANGRCKFWI